MNVVCVPAHCATAIGQDQLRVVVELFRQPAHAVDEEQSVCVLLECERFLNRDVFTIARQSPTDKLAQRHDHLGGLEGPDFWGAHAVFILSKR